jgi:hypothetical protein
MSAEDIAYSGLAEAAMVGIMNEADRARTLNMEIEVDLTHTGGPLGYVLLGWREDAKQALINLAVQDPNDTEAIRALQNKVVIYLEAIAAMNSAGWSGTFNTQTLKNRSRTEHGQRTGTERHRGRQHPAGFHQPGRSGPHPA